VLNPARFVGWMLREKAELWRVASRYDSFGAK
jgi:hypothetical protein